MLSCAMQFEIGFLSLIGLRLCGSALAFFHLEFYKDCDDEKDSI